MSHEANRTTIVTGSALGIGQGIAREFLRRGHHVVAVDIDRAGLDRLLEETASELGEEVRMRISLVHGSVGDESTWTAAVAAAEQTSDPVGILVNNAAISPKHAGARAPLSEIARDEWDAVLLVNLTGVFLGMQAVFPAMKAQGWGRIINISSQAGRTGARLAGAHYGATKAGVLGLTRTAAHEFGPYGVTVNAVAPGRIMTPMAAGVSAEVNQNMLAQIPVGRLGMPADIAHLVAFLASPEAGFITGATVDSNGGSFMG